MSAWKEWQLRMKSDSATDEEVEESRREYAYECWRDYMIDKALEELERSGEWTDGTK